MTPAGIYGGKGKDRVLRPEPRTNPCPVCGADRTPVLPLTPPVARVLLEQLDRSGLDLAALELRGRIERLLPPGAES